MAIVARRPPSGSLARLLVPVVGVATLLPWVSTGAALVAGIVLALVVGNPWPATTRMLAHETLVASVVGLGAGMNLAVVARVGAHGVGYTMVGIATALTVGTILGRRLGVARDASLLITVGTAICGGSAIAAVAPTIGAKEHDVSMALVVVFLLNAVALFLFPAIGHRLHLSQDAFGIWAALAIHDTSSVVGAASQYGSRALEVATAAKLARALWIVPVVVAVARIRRRAGEGGAGRAKKPWFILGFVGAAAIVTWLPALRGAGHLVAAGAQRLLAGTLFLIGLGLTRPALRALGVRPLLQGLGLWVVLGAGTLGAILVGWIA